MMEAERIALCGPKSCSHVACSAYRGGHVRSRVVPGGLRITTADCAIKVGRTEPPVMTIPQAPCTRAA